MRSKLFKPKRVVDCSCGLNGRQNHWFLLYIIRMDLPVVILAEKIGLKGQFFDVVLGSQQVVVLVAVFNHVLVDSLQRFGVGPEGKLRLSQQCFLIKSEEELEACLHDLNALVDHQRDESQHLFEENFSEERRIFYLVHQSLVSAAFLIRSQQKYQKFLKIQSFGDFLYLRQGDFILCLSKLRKGSDRSIIDLLSDVSLGPDGNLLAKIRANPYYFFVLCVSDPEGEDGSGADWCLFEDGIIFG